MRFEFVSPERMNIRPGHTTDNSAIGTLSAGFIGKGDEIYDVPEDVFKGTIKIQHKYDKWFKVLEGGSTIGWVAVVHQGRVYGQLTDTQVPPSPAPDPILPVAVSIRMDLPNGKIVFLEVHENEETKLLVVNTDYEFQEVLINGDTYIKSIEG